MVLYKICRLVGFKLDVLKNYRIRKSIFLKNIKKNFLEALNACLTFTNKIGLNEIPPFGNLN